MRSDRDDGLRSVAGIMALLLCWSVPTRAAAQLQVLGCHYREDLVLPEHARFWFEDLAVKQDQSEEGLRSWYEKRPTGGSVHVFVRNPGPLSLDIGDTLLGGISLKKAIAFSDQRVNRKPASIYFADLPAAELDQLLTIGEPIWWRVEPRQIPAGGTGEVLVRLRRRPQAASLGLDLQHANGRQRVSVPIRSNQPRVESVSFSPDLRHVCLFFRCPARPGLAPVRILLDGEQITDGLSSASDRRLEVAPVMLQLASGLERGSFHCFQGIYEDGAVASAAVRVFSDEFAYGIWGGRPGSASDVAGAQAHVRELSTHNINVQMPQVGSAMLSAFYASDAGQAVCDSLGLRRLVNDPGKWRTRDPIAYFIHDEPDCGDYLIKGLEPDHQVGSLAQWAVQRTQELRAADPTTPQLLNVDLTFKPDNWYTYGQLPDVFCVDPYYQVRLWEAYGRHPARLPLYTKAAFVHAVACVARAASSPRPLHVVLYACRRGNDQEDPGDGRAERPALPERDRKGQRQPKNKETVASRFHRFPTPQEKRIEVYYALAGGAKGLSYWWFTPSGGKSQGVGAKDPQAAALWREIGLLGAEVRTAGPLLWRSCPAEVPVKVSPGVWVRSLLAGTDTLILIAVNDQYVNSDQGTSVRPVDNAHVAVDLPSWLAPRQAFTIDATGLQSISLEKSGPAFSVSLGTLTLTRLVVITASPGLRDELHSLYTDNYASNVQRLLQQPDP
ncbi:MAG TPA: hypothetical protein PKY77_00040 [Phycisphaerae bacterium]|nr:hypothetical protein [Phycisphaerae bacterium]HRY69658.1 hypothetical protein [Phycisphaerae bacterium]